MGQLEKYGLYVLCLVIFLILGVTIWGPGPDLQPKSQRVDAGLSGLKAEAPPSDDARRPGPVGSLTDMLGGGSKATPGDQDHRGNGGGDKPVKVEPTPHVEPIVPGDGKRDLPQDDPKTKPAPAGERPSYKIVAGDSFERIARDRLGNPALQALIVKLNPRIDPRKLQVGQTVLLPNAEEIAQGKPVEAADKRGSDKPEPVVAVVPPATGTTRSYKVVGGDTLEGIARRELGSIKRVNEVKDLNPSVNPRTLRIGQQILLPKK